MAVVPSEERGTVSALSNLPSQVTSALTPGLAGYIFDNISLELPFEIGAALQAVNACLFYFFFHALRPPEERAAPTAPSVLGDEAGDAAGAEAEEPLLLP